MHRHDDIEMPEGEVCMQGGDWVGEVRQRLVTAQVDTKWSGSMDQLATGAERSVRVPVKAQCLMDQLDGMRSTRRLAGGGIGRWEGRRMALRMDSWWQETVGESAEVEKVG
jgi:hypothetical protein